MPNQRTVLENVPRVHFYEGGKRCPEDIILPSVVRAVLEYLGDEDYGCKHCPVRDQVCKVFCTYAFLVGVSGAAAYFSWKEGWHGDNVAPFFMSDDPGAPERHIFDAIGYTYEPVMKEDGRDNEAVFRQRIRESLDRGMPVVAYGVVGPSEAAIVAGYDEGGDVLIGWSFFQNLPEFNASVEFEPGREGQPGYFRKRDWFKDTESLLIIGDKKPKPSLNDISRDTLRWLLKVARTPVVRPEPDAPEWYRNRHNGLAAYDAWADHLLRDAEWPAGDEATLRAHHRIHDDAISTVAEARWYGSVFLAEIAEHFAGGPGKPGASEHILHAAACYAAEHDLMWQLWDLAGGIQSPEAFRAMTDPAKRRAMADIIRQAHDKDAEAAQHFEQALQ
ncbi:MAG: hypothetical protein JXA21_09725 [Anaerolineae bacterium]|nr:hypothetical protein [Anaerolineae bacterium]